MTPFQVTMFITTIANIIAEDKSEKEIELLTALFVLLSENLATISILKGGESTQEEVITNIQ
nr:hypothetical protein [uncultured Aminipila sp.]